MGNALAKLGTRQHLSQVAELISSAEEIAEESERGNQFSSVASHAEES